MSKICFVIYDLENAGGTERITTIIANGLARRGYEVSILTIKSYNKCYFQLENNVKTYSLEDNPKDKAGNSKISKILKLRSFLKNNKIDAVITVDSILCMFTIPATLALKCKAICWEHFNYKITLGKKVRAQARIFAMLFCKKIVVLTHKDENYWLQSKFQIKRNQLQVIYNPSIYDVQANNYKTSARTIISIGRLTEQKGFDLLLTAWGLVKNKEGWLLKIIGNGKEKIKLEKMVDELNLNKYVEILPATNNLEPHFSSSSVYCLSSRYEGFVLTMLEAQAFGLPIIAFDCDCGPSELLNFNNGFLIKQFSINEFAQKLTILIDNPELRKKMSKNSTINAKNFTIPFFIERWVALLENLD